VKSLIVCVSVEHGNTREVVDAMADVLGATIMEPEEIEDFQFLSEYDLIGFGAGIYYGFHHKRLRNFIKGLPLNNSQKAFLVTTNGVRSKLYMKMLNININSLKKQLQKKGFDIVGDFSCGGISDWAFFKLIGGISKGRPNAEDLENAKKFTKRLMPKGKYERSVSCLTYQIFN
jgi:flavodoxin